MRKIIQALSLILVVARAVAVDAPEFRIGRTYWINDRSEDTAPVNFLTSGGKPIVFNTSHSFVVLEADPKNPRDPVYKVKLDDGQELFLRQSDLTAALFNAEQYGSNGSVRLPFRQFIFLRPPSEVTAELDRKEAATRRAAVNAKRAKDAAFAEQMAKADAIFKANQAARMARGGVRLGMTPEQARQTSWLAPEHINLTTTAQGQQEQWVYEKQNYLYFTNGVLTGIQNHSDDGVYGRSK